MSILPKRAIDGFHAGLDLFLVADVHLEDCRFTALAV